LIKLEGDGQKWKSSDVVLFHLQSIGRRCHQPLVRFKGGSTPTARRETPYGHLTLPPLWRCPGEIKTTWFRNLQQKTELIFFILRTEEILVDLDDDFTEVEKMGSGV
jgi:hypothetical protein